MRASIRPRATSLTVAIKVKATVFQVAV